MATWTSIRSAVYQLGVSTLFLFLAAAPLLGQDGVEDIDPFSDAPATQDGADDELAIPGFADEAPVPSLDEPGADQPETRESLLEKVKQLVANEQWEEALNEMARNPNPRDGEFALERGKAFLGLGDKQLALTEFDIAATYGGPFPGVTEEALRKLGELKLELGQVQEAVDDLTQAVRFDPANAELLTLRGKALVRLVRLLGSQGAEQLQDAKQTLDRAIDADSENAEAYSERSNVYLLRSDYNKAIVDLELAASKDPESSDIQARAGIARLSRAANERVRYDVDLDQVVDDYAAAVDHFGKFLAVEGDKTKDDYEDADPELITSGQAHLFRAVSQLGLANNSATADKSSLYQSIISDCDATLEFDADNPEAIHQKAVAQRLSGDLDGAVETLSDALRLSPDYAEARLRRGIIYYYLNDMTMARGDFEQCLESMADGRAPFWLGVTYARLGMYRDAIRYYTQAIRENPLYKPAYSNRALAYAKLERYDQAIEDYNKLIRLDHEDTVAIQRRDQARQQMGVRGY